MRLQFFGLVCLLLVAFPAFAQDGGITVPVQPDVDTSSVTDDQVNEIASKMYCPVCENIPLDTCGTAACDDWREEIRIMTAQGMSEEDIMSNFVMRFGDRVVGTPQDPVLRALSLVTPWVLTFLLAWVAFKTILGRRKPASRIATESTSPDTKEQSYRDLLEKDLIG